jgi:hypothetical protein
LLIFGHLEEVFAEHSFVLRTPPRRAVVRHDAGSAAGPKDDVFDDGEVAFVGLMVSVLKELLVQRHGWAGGNDGLVEPARIAQRDGVGRQCPGEVVVLVGVGVGCGELVIQVDGFGGGRMS